VNKKKEKTNIKNNKKEELKIKVLTHELLVSILLSNANSVVIL
jgi:hypothetical protein